MVIRLIVESKIVIVIFSMNTKQSFHLKSKFLRKTFDAKKLGSLSGVL